jgi:hypothetical protein
MRLAIPPRQTRLDPNTASGPTRDQGRPWWQPRGNWPPGMHFENVSQGILDLEDAVDGGPLGPPPAPPGSYGCAARLAEQSRFRGGGDRRRARHRHRSAASDVASAPSPDPRATGARGDGVGVRNGYAGPPIEPDLVPPPPQRGQHDEIIRSDRQVPDSRGAVGLPWRSVGLLLSLHHKAKITDDELEAAYRFPADFDRAHFDALRVPDIARVRVQLSCFKKEAKTSVYDAGERVMAAVNALGGIASPAGSIAWHVIGADETPRLWCTSRYTSRRVAENAAQGVLLAALGTLVSYYQRGKE